jgi:hypothetical protein
MVKATHTSGGNRDALPEKRNTSPDERNASPENPDAPAEKRNAPPQKRNAPQEGRDEDGAARAGWLARATPQFGVPVRRPLMERPES